MIGKDEAFSATPDTMFLLKISERCFFRKHWFAVFFIAFIVIFIAHAQAATPAPLNPSAEEVNQAFGIPLFTQEGFGQESAADVAERLGLRKESETATESGYRLTPHADLNILGVRSFSLFLQGIGGKAARFSMIFANKGDIGAYASNQDRHLGTNVGIQTIALSPQMIQTYQAAIRHDGDRLKSALTTLLGPSIPATLGKVAGMDERGDRWNWQGSSLILSSPRNEYVALRVLPTALFDDSNAERRSFMATKGLIAGRVIHRPNGDVIITDMPMVDQGDKGYCVPATYERVLRYYGLSADMNLLAMAGHTQAGGGTSVSSIAMAAYGYVREAGGKIISGISGSKITDIQPYIDKGEPVLWALYSSEELNNRLGERMSQRAEVTDSMAAKEWNQKALPTARKNAKTLPKKEGHVCLIIGYNHDTHEIAISDSWGPEYIERWLTEEEAQAVNLGEGTVIGW
jgi:hypothetical protein